MDNENYSREELIPNSYLKNDFEQPTRYYNREADSEYEQPTRYYNREDDSEYEQPLRRYNRPNEETARNKKPDKNKKDYLTHLILIQSIVCVVLFLFLVIVSKASSNSYSILKHKLNNIISNDMTVSEVVDAFKNAAGFLIEPASQWKNNDESVNATTKKSEESTKSATTTTPATTTPTTMNEMSTTAGAGGEDIVLDNLNSRPENTTFAPYMTTTKITLPVQGGKISSYFGFRTNPVNGKYSFHTGLDLAAESKSKIAAAYNGIVEKSGENATSGKFVLLKHANGLETYYCHCSEISVIEGANVNAGDTIALVGSTGSSTGPHLHFEIRINGIRYNPLWLLKGMVDEA